MDFIRKSAAVAAASVALASGLAVLTSSSASATTAGHAVVLKLSESVRHKLADAYWNHSKEFKRSKVDGPTHVYYGKLNGVYWAVGSIGVKGKPISYQDGPHIWRRTAHGHWVYRSDTGGCLEAVPKAMLKAWHLPRGC
ncbi:MAG: hypothetical protein HOY71_47695 [Nonomuraea sp.]|nr:hypothetical protein [Nonomuraea sp.]